MYFTCQECCSKNGIGTCLNVLSCYEKFNMAYLYYLDSTSEDPTADLFEISKKVEMVSSEIIAVYSVYERMRTRYCSVDQLKWNTCP